MRAWTWVAASVALVAATGFANAQHREAGAHAHGRGTLNIALEGKHLSMELEAPGADIVGFEHKAQTDAQKAALEKAEQQLMAPQTLFELPAAAGCTFVTAAITVEGDTDHGHDHDHAATKDGDKDHDHDHQDHAGYEHSGFRVEYDFECKTPTSLTSIGFGYFKAFAGAQKLDVTVVTPKGQSKLEASRDKPHIELGGLI